MVDGTELDSAIAGGDADFTAVAVVPAVDIDIIPVVVDVPRVNGLADVAVDVEAAVVPVAVDATDVPVVVDVALIPVVVDTTDVTVDVDVAVVPVGPVVPVVVVVAADDVVVAAVGKGFPFGSRV